MLEITTERREFLCKLCEEWIDTLSYNDVDLINKVDNLSLDNELLETLILSSKELREEITNKIIDKVCNDKKSFAELIVDETIHLYEDELASCLCDFSAGLYNLDGLYCIAIETVMTELTHFLE